MASKRDPEDNSDGPSSSLTAEELQSALTAADPGAFLLSRRLLRRVIKFDRGMIGYGLHVPHRKSYVIGRDRLFQLADASELGIPAGSELPERVTLLARPKPGQLEAMPRGEALIKYWRLLFHARVHLALERLAEEGKLTEAGVRERVRRIGQAEFDEVRAVLRQEDYLLPPRDQRTVYVEFAAVYLELRYFAGPLLTGFFPTLHAIASIDRVLAADLDADRLYADTRPPGTPDPTPAAAAAGSGGADVEDVELPLAPDRPSGRLFRRLARRAKDAAGRGNAVRAAILWARSARFAAPEELSATRAAARAELERLAARLREALKLDDTETRAWRRSLPALLGPASRGIWPVASRLLYDLQKVCLDHERELFAVDLVAWGLSLGRRPVKRPLPRARKVLLLKHLRRAAERLPAASIPVRHRQTLDGLLHDAIGRQENRLREHFRPVLQAALEEVGLTPRNLPEQLARDKLVEELLDRVTERGFLTLGDLRDALSRSNLKFPDLGGPAEFLDGDALLRADRRLALELDGVYRRGEVYLRWLQRFSALGFGTRVGRFLTRFLALPFGGAYVVLKGVEELVHLGHKGLAYLHGEESTPAAHLVNWPSVLGLGVLLLALLHLPAFRGLVARAAVTAYRGVRGVIIDLPAWLLRQPVVRGVLQSRPVLVFRRFLFRPLLLTALLAPLFPLAGIDGAAAWAAAAAVFTASALVFPTRPWRALEEVTLDAVAYAWRQLRLDVIPGLFRWVMYVFNRFKEEADRLIYTVDEWLRFRSGDSRLALVAKPALGVGWFLVTYVARIYINLLIEPTVNPIKHFPVVTVAAKVLLPFTVELTNLFAAPLRPLGDWIAYPFAAVTFFFFPGVFGFLVWELKENWRLYRANRPRTLRPVVIGSHGETMVRLLRPGLHSGTLPKLYARLRRAERRAQRSGNWRAAERQRDALHHVEESVRHFVEREFVSLLRQSRSWGAADVSLGVIGLGSNRLSLGIRRGGPKSPELVLAFEEQAGWLVAGVARPGWLSQLSSDQRQTLAAALVGLYKMAGVDLVREQLEAGFARAFVYYDIGEEGLVVWPSDTPGVQAVYPLGETPVLTPQWVGGVAPLELAPLPADQVFFDRVPVAWERWVEAWQRDQDGKGPPPDLVPGFNVLPGGSPTR